MGLKLEKLIILSIFLIVVSAVVLKIDKSASDNEKLIKELEFTNTTFTEVNREKLQGRIYSTYGTREKGVLNMDNLLYMTENIKYLSANKGKMSTDTLHLEGNIAFEEKEGYTYKTDEASYNQKTEILYVTTPFIAQDGENSIKGDSLVYHADTKDIFATKIEAVIYTAEK